MPAFVLVICLVLTQTPRVADDAVSYQTRKQLFDALDSYAANPTNEQGTVCGTLIDQMIANMPKPTLNYYIDGAKAAELLGFPEKAMSILKDVAANLGPEKWPGVGQTVGVGANMWFGRIARDSGHPEEAADAFLRAADAAVGEYAPVVRSMCLSYAGEVYASILDQPDKAATLFEQAGDMSGFEKGDQEGQFYKNWAERNLQNLRGNASDLVAAPSGMLDPQLLLYPVLNGVTLANSQVMGVYGNARYTLTVPYLDRQTEESRSVLDQEISQMLLAGEYAADKRRDDSEALLRRLFDSDGFLAPVAELKLAQAFREQRQPDKAQEVIDELANRWPNSDWPLQIARMVGLSANQSGEPRPITQSQDGLSKRPKGTQTASVAEPTAEVPKSSNRTLQHARPPSTFLLTLVTIGSGLLFGLLTFLAGSLIHRRPV